MYRNVDIIFKFECISTSVQFANVKFNRNLSRNVIQKFLVIVSVYVFY